MLTLYYVVNHDLSDIFVCYDECSSMQTDRSVLHYAAEVGFHDAAKLLLQKQADANAVDKVVNSKIYPFSLRRLKP